MLASAKIQKNKKVAFEDGNCNAKREPRSRSRGKARERRAKSQDVRSSGNKDVEPRKRDRSLISLVRQGSRKSVSNLVKLFEAGKNYYVSIHFVFIPLMYKVPKTEHSKLQVDKSIYLMGWGK